MEREITITVTDDEARRIEERVAAGEFRSVSDYVHTAVSAALAQDGPYPGEDMELLRRLIAESLDDDGPSIPIDEAFARVHAHIDNYARHRGKA